MRAYHWSLHRLVFTSALLGNAAVEGRGADTRDGVDTAGDGAIALGAVFGGSIDRVGGLVSSDDVDGFGDIQYAGIVSGCGADTGSRPGISHFSSGDSGGDAEHFYWFVHGVGHIVFDAGGGGDSRSEIGAWLVCKLGAGLGGVWEGLRGACDYGGFLFDDHDRAV